MIEDTITLDWNGQFIKILINDSLHLVIKYEDLLSIHSWINGKGWYCIEFYLKNTTVKSEYDDIKRWKTILSLLNECLK